MLLKQYLTPELKEQLQNTSCECGFTLEDIIRSGEENPDGAIGVYAGDKNCYHTFSPLFDPIIEDYHQYKLDEKHSKNLDYEQLGELPLLDPKRKYIISTRIRVGRNIKGYALPPAIATFARAFVESEILTALNQLDNEHAGQYYPLSDLSDKDRDQLIEDHFLFKKGDRFLESAGVNRNWPNNRGIFHSENKRFLVWVNEEDQLRIISMQEGGDILKVFKRLVQGIQKLEKNLTFQFDEHLGYISSCPTNLGTSLRASVHIKLPQLEKSNGLKEACEKLQLSLRGTHGEHSKAESGVWDISNKRRLGLTEVDCITTLYNGLKELIRLEKGLEQ